jgi:Integrase core domain
MAKSTHSSRVLRRMLAFTELKFSNSMIEAWWRSLKHQWLFLHSLDSVSTVRRLVAFYVDEHNRVLPHSAFRGQTPDEMYFGTGDAVPADLTSHAAAARRARGEANRSAACATAHQSTQPPDDRVLTTRVTTRPTGPSVWRRVRKTGERTSPE